MNKYLINKTTTSQLDLVDKTADVIEQYVEGLITEQELAHKLTVMYANVADNWEYPLHAKIP